MEMDAGERYRKALCALPRRRSACAECFADVLEKHTMAAAAVWVVGVSAVLLAAVGALTVSVALPLAFLLGL